MSASVSPIDLSAPVDLLPVGVAVEAALGYRPHPSTLSRWTRQGVRGVRLVTVIVAGRPRTTVEAVLRFVAESTERNAPPALDA